MEIPIIKENYARIWNETIPKPGTYKQGEKRKHQFVEFIAKTKFSQEDWDFWMDRISHKPWNKTEQEFITTLIKNRFITRRVIMMNSITATIEAEGQKILESKPIQDEVTQ